MTDQGLFTAFEREYRPLSTHLRDRKEVDDLFHAVRRAATLEELDRFRGRALIETIAQIRPTAPSVGSPAMGQISEDKGTWRIADDGTRLPTTRYYVRSLVQGDIELLRRWPDDVDAQLLTVDHELMERIGGYDNLATASEGDTAEYWRLRDTWTLQRVTDRGPWALYTYFDLTSEEEQDSAATGGIGLAFSMRYGEVKSIVAAISAQTNRFFDEDLPRTLESIASDRESTLLARTEIIRSLALPSEWAAAPISLAQEDPARDAGAAARAGEISHTNHERTTPDQVAELETTSSHRLSEKSFSDIQRILRTWADAVERNPRGFTHLDEDSISDLVAATLNATTPHAGREVYSRSGRTDVFIMADVLGAGLGPSKVFICESKFAKGQASIREALEDQIFRYATAHTTSAVLLVFCPQQRFLTAQRNVIRWAEVAAGHVRTEKNASVEGWPMLTYHVEGRNIKVCVATVALPRVTTRTGAKK